ncbi:MAG: hypothetical protein ACOZAO_04435 [Patescibacteria group bacterium]
MTFEKELKLNKQTIILFAILLLITGLGSFYSGKYYSNYKSFTAKDWSVFYEHLDGAYIDYKKCIDENSTGEVYYFYNTEDRVNFDTANVTCKEELDNTLYLLKKSIELGKDKAIIQRGYREYEVLEL